jgi:hypothetical protein
VASVEPLRRGVADVVVAHLDEIPADIASETVAELHPCVVLPRDVVLPRGGAPRRITPSALRSLADLTFLAYPEGSRHFDLQRQALARRGLVPKRIMHLDTADVILGFVASGLGWSLVPSLDPNGPSGPRLLALPLRRPKRTFPVQMAWRKDAPTHPLLDAHTAYGTQLFWPSALTPASWATLFIIDPLYTLPLLAGMIAVLIRPASRTAGRWLAAGLVLSTLYLGWSWTARTIVTAHARQCLDAQGVTDARLFITPAPLTTTTASSIITAPRCWSRLPARTTTARRWPFILWSSSLPATAISATSQ